MNDGKDNSDAAWFCLRSQPKHEHIAAAHLRLQNIEVFFPRIRFQRTTRLGTSWVTEALFPNYLFAQFNWKQSLRQVYHSPGVSEVIHFGDFWPVISDTAIVEMRTCFDQNEINIISPAILPGDAVRLIGGCLHGLRAIVTEITSGGKRIAVLLDFLGRQTSVKLDLGGVIKETNEREYVLARNS